MVCFLIKPFIVHLYNEYCNYWPDSLSTNKGEMVEWVPAKLSKSEGNNTVLFSQEKQPHTLGSINQNSGQYWVEEVQSEREVLQTWPFVCPHQGLKSC